MPKADWTPTQFIGQEIEVHFDRQPALRKKPGPPAAFVWEGESHCVVEMISEWFDYQRKGKMAKNMRPAHAATAVKRGSWGVGRFYFRLRTETGRVFDLYYDRAPKEAADRSGHWFLWRELRRVDPTT